MPAILNEETVVVWLDPLTTETENLQSILVPAANDLLKAIPVSTRVNSYNIDEPRLIDEINIDEPAGDERQLGLFDDQSE